MEHIYKTPFRLLGKFGENNLKKEKDTLENTLEDNKNY